MRLARRLSGVIASAHTLAICSTWTASLSWPPWQMAGGRRATPRRPVHGRCSLRALTLNDEAGDLPDTCVAGSGAVVHAMPAEAGVVAGASQELDRSGVGEAVLGEGDEDVL